MTIGKFSEVTGISAYTLRYQGDSTMEERKELLTRHREFVVEERKRWDGYLCNLDEKIGIYRKRIKESRRQ